MWSFSKDLCFWIDGYAALVTQAIPVRMAARLRSTRANQQPKQQDVLKSGAKWQPEDGCKNNICRYIICVHFRYHVYDCLCMTVVSSIHFRYWCLCHVYSCVNMCNIHQISVSQWSIFPESCRRSYWLSKSFECVANSSTRHALLNSIPVWPGKI